MPISGSPTVSNIVNAQIATGAAIDPTKLAFTTMGAWLRKITAQSINDSSLTPVNFTDADLTDAFPSGYTQLHDPASNPSRIILRQKGLWLVAAVLAYNGATGTGTPRYAYITKNGSTIVAPVTYISAASQPWLVSATGLVYTSLNTDYVELQAYHTQGSAVNVGDYGSGTFFGCAWLGDNV